MKNFIEEKVPNKKLFPEGENEKKKFLEKSFQWHQRMDQKRNISTENIQGEKVIRKNLFKMKKRISKEEKKEKREEDFLKKQF